MTLQLNNNNIKMKKRIIFFKTLIESAHLSNLSSFWNLNLSSCSFKSFSLSPSPPFQLSHSLILPCQVFLVIFPNNVPITISQIYCTSVYVSSYIFVPSRFSHVQLCNPMDCSLPGSFVHGILQARILEWVAIPSSNGSCPSRDRTCISCVSCIDRQVL